MNRHRTLFAAALGLAALFATLPTTRVQAQYSDEFRQPVESPERVNWELHLGPYQPNTGNSAFTDVYGSDRGPMLAMEFDAHIVRIPYVGLFSMGVRGAWARYTANACQASAGTIDCSQRTDENEKFVLLPLSGLAVLRVDVLARQFNVPIVLSGKIGLDAAFWRTKRGGTRQGSGLSLGLRWGLQLAVELDFIEPRAAHSLDEDWGINHSYVFFEIYGSQTNSRIPMRDTFTFSAGLGLAF